MDEEEKSLEEILNQPDHQPEFEGLSETDPFEKLEKKFPEVEKPKCKKCGSTNLIRESWTKRIAPNEYDLYDKIICQKCKVMRIEDVAKINKNTPETREIIKGKKSDLEEYKNKKKVVPQEEINVNQIQF